MFKISNYNEALPETPRFILGMGGTLDRLYLMVRKTKVYHISRTDNPPSLVRLSLGMSLFINLLSVKRFFVEPPVVAALHLIFGLARQRLLFHARSICPAVRYNIL